VISLNVRARGQILVYEAEMPRIDATMSVFQAGTESPFRAEHSQEPVHASAANTARSASDGGILSCSSIHGPATTALSTARSVASR